MIMLLTCTSISVMASDVQSDTADQDEKMTIGVSVYNLNDAEVREFRNYFENYVGMAFEVEFLYSWLNSVHTVSEYNSIKPLSGTGKPPPKSIAHILMPYFLSMY